jgi:sugar O-acyltransferase (sialic acid O-acetyltransferase NeuD family)
VAAFVESNDARRAEWELQGFVDDDEDLHETSVMGHPVLGDVDWLSRQSGAFFAVAIGNGATRRGIADQLSGADVQSPPLCHASVSLHRTTRVGSGAILCNGAAPTVNVRIGAYTVLDQHCTVGHDSTLGDFVTLHPGTCLSGNVHLETGVTMGAGSVVLPNTRIGAHTTVGAGAVVTDDLPPRCTAVGVPAQPLS